MNVTKLKPKGLSRMDARRFEWSALFAVALLLAVMSPSFAASALAMSPSLGGPVTAISSTSSQSCSTVLQWFQSVGNSHSERKSVFAITATGPVSLEASRQIELPQFATFAESSPAPAPQFAFPREHAPHLFAHSLNHHEAAFLNGVRNNRSID